MEQFRINDFVMTEDSMKANRTFRMTRNTMEQLRRAFVAMFLLSLFVSPALADHYVQPVDVTPPPLTAPNTVPADSRNRTPKPAPPVVQEKSAELIQVEAAMGRNMGREYTVYMSMTQPNPNRPFGFAGYLQDKYESRRMAGIILAAIVAPIIASITIAGTVQLYRHALRDGGGFCNHVYYDDVEDEYDTDCEGDRGEVSGMILISTIGGLATLGVLIPGLARISRYNRRLRRIQHLTARADTKASNIRFTYALNPRDVSIGFKF
jgi:hypothetical protein